LAYPDRVQERGRLRRVRSHRRHADGAAGQRQERAGDAAEREVGRWEVLRAEPHRSARA